MALRLVLVGVVASLGLTLPSREVLESWTCSGQAWVNARLAEWEASRPMQEGTFVYLDDSAVSESRGQETGTAVARVDSLDQVFKSVVDEWVESASKAAPAVAMEKKADPAPVVLPDWLEAKLAEGAAGLVLDPARFQARSDAIVMVAKKSEPESPWPVAPEVADQDQAFNAVIDEMVTSFSEDLAAIEKARALTAAPREPSKFEPMEVGEDLYPGVAYALNREAEGLAPIAPPVVADVKVSPTRARSSRVANAVRLTREAVNAWASVLHGSAVVAIAR